MSHTIVKYAQLMFDSEKFYKLFDKILPRLSESLPTEPRQAPSEPKAKKNLD